MLRSLSVAASAVLLAGGVMVIVGWIAGIEAFKSISPGWAAMRFNTATCFVLSGVSLWCLRDEHARKGLRSTGLACAVVVLLLAVATLAEHLLDVSLGIDQALMNQSLTAADTGAPGRMSVATSMCFMLVGITLLRLDKKDRRGHRPALALPLVTGTIGLVAFVGYLYGARALYAYSSVSSMAAHTATLFIVASLGLLCARPDKGPLGILTAEGVGSTMARRILPFAIVLPFGFGWLRMRGQLEGFYGFEFGLALFATTNVAVFAVLVWLTAVSLNRTDAVRRQSEAALRDSEERFRALLEHSSDSISLIDQNNGILYVSPSVAAVEGYTAEELTGRNGIENTHPDDLPLLEKVVKELVDNPGKPIPVLWRRRHKSGEWIWLEGVATNLLDNPAVRGIVTNYRDVTGRIQAEQAIRQLNENLSARNAELDAERSRWKSVVQGIADEVWICGLDGRMTLVSLPDVTHLSMDGMKEKSIEQVEEQVEMLDADGRPRPSDRTPLLLALAGETLRGEEILRNRRSGIDRWRQFSAAPIRDAAGAIIGSVAVARDITDRKLAEEEIRRLNAELEERVEQRTAELRAKNRELETFSYSVSHDLKAPLRGIDGYSHLLLEYGEGLDEEARGFLRSIRSAAGKMQELIDDLLAYSKLERSHLSADRVDPVLAVNTVLAERERDLEHCQVSVDVVAQEVHADPEGLSMALRNLVDNAVKFSSQRRPPLIEISSRVEGDRHIISVRDNGTGFDMKYHDRIFQIFQRLHRAEDYDGTGVGLAIVHKAMERMGGRVWAQSESGKGATFYLELRSAGSPATLAAHGGMARRAG